jgi:ATP-dependent DNA helicase RecQ
VRSRKRTKEISDLLEANGIPSTFYHAGLTHSTKDIRQQRWHNDETRVMVATNAFGMGIDKPDVRMVIHYDSPDSIEAYFQEAGRAGRDGKRAYAVLLYDKRDTQKLIKRIDTNFPPKDYIIKVYEDLAYYYQIAAGSGYGHTFSFEIEKFCHIFKHYPLQAHSALVILARAQYIEYETDPESRARLMFLLNRNELYRLDDLTQQEDALITALLRLYGSLFVDYTFIDLGLVADYSQIPQQEIYLMLKSLSQRRILHFIPESKTPYITYT